MPYHSARKDSNMWIRADDIRFVLLVAFLVAFLSLFLTLFALNVEELQTAVLASIPRKRVSIGIYFGVQLSFLLVFWFYLWDLLFRVFLIFVLPSFHLCVLVLLSFAAVFLLPAEVLLLLVLLFLEADRFLMSFLRCVFCYAFCIASSCMLDLLCIRYSLLQLRTSAVL